AAAFVGMGERLPDLLDRIDRVDRRAEPPGHHLPAEVGIDLADLLWIALGEVAAEHEAGQPDAAIDEVVAADLGVLAAHRAVVHDGGFGRHAVADPAGGRAADRLDAKPDRRLAGLARDLGREI